MLIYFIILNIWFFRFSNNGYLGELLKFENENFYFTPHLTSLIYILFENFLNLKFSGYLIVVIIPMIILFLTNKVFRFFLSSKLSFLLALLTQSIYNNINLRDIFLNFSEIISLMKDDYLLIFNFPLPSISSLIFLFILYRILSKGKFSNLVGIFATTILTFSFFYISAIDSLFLISAWLIYLFFDLKKLTLKNKISHLFLGTLIIMPGLYYGNIKQIHEYSTLNFYNIILYNFLPLILSIFLYIVKRIDLKEVWYKFKVIYIFIFVEIFINLLVYLKIFNLDLLTVNKQILQYPIHMMYYLPLIYYIKRKPFEYNYGIESQKFSLNLSKASYFLYERTKNYIFYSLIVLILYFNSPK